jgi:hypothetical protein
MLETGRRTYRRHAALLYRFFSAGLSALSHIRPLFTLALRILTGGKRKIKGQVVPVNAHLGSAVQVLLTKEKLERLISESPAVGLMDECLCRAVGGCEKYPKELGCLVLGEAARALHPGLGRLVGKEEALAHAGRALRLGLAPTAVRMKSEALLWSLDKGGFLTVCFCCPCCCLMRKSGRRAKPSRSMQAS